MTRTCGEFVTSASEVLKSLPPSECYAVSLEARRATRSSSCQEFRLLRTLRLKNWGAQQKAEAVEAAAIAEAKLLCFASRFLRVLQAKVSLPLRRRFEGDLHNLNIERLSCWQFLKHFQISAVFLICSDVGAHELCVLKLRDNLSRPKSGCGWRQNKSGPLRFSFYVWL